MKKGRRVARPVQRASMEKEIPEISVLQTTVLVVQFVTVVIIYKVIDAYL